MKKEEIIKLRIKGLNYNEISKILKCSKSTISYHCSKLLENDNIKISNGYKKSANKNKNDSDIDIEKIKDFYIKNNKSIKKTSGEFNLSVNKIKKLLNIIPFIKKCVHCDSIFYTNINNKKCCSDICRKNFRKQYMKDRNYEYDNLVNWRYEIKKKAIEYKGGSCVICGYNKCQRSLEFHHLKPDEKDFSISQYKNKKFENLQYELDKCILVCGNCHGEIHDGFHKDILINYYTT